MKATNQGDIVPSNLISHLLDECDASERETFTEDYMVLRKELIVVGKGEQLVYQLPILVIEWNSDVARRVAISRIKEGFWGRLSNREWKVLG